MAKSVPKPAPDPAEQRKLVRKNVLLSGVLCDANGEAASECTVHDMHTQGAAVSRGNLTVNSRVFLIDVGNNNAHEARVAWSRDDRSGLQFTRSYTFGLRLAAQFEIPLQASLRSEAGAGPACRRRRRRHQTRPWVRRIDQGAHSSDGPARGRR